MIFREEASVLEALDTLLEGRLTKTRSEIEAAIEAQKALCAAKNYPHFAPANGVCWARGCRRQIYEILDGKSLVTGCPHCSRSYCD